MKKRTSAYIDAELLEWAKQNKIKLSQLLEEAIKSIQNEEKLNSEGFRVPSRRGSRVQIPPPAWLVRRNSLVTNSFEKI
ncbi:type II toxin-antitoxin system CcdA family antitoxin [Ferroglobus placidus]|uniref:type II toxin-antitoxin system CcdA family antitoxin n=1 Tax=Ferroglobus placidus TaxID=54261 RepID=UPI00064E927F|nr:type II toxin-antitoxin system CcdA family antitoxin [Ferroglobus placidus]